MAARVIDTLEEIEQILKPGRLRPRRSVNGRRYVMLRVRPTGRQRVADTIDVAGLGRCDLVSGDFTARVAHVLAPRHKVEAFVARQRASGSEVE